MVTSGFFDSVNYDRVYNAEQFSSIFDGLISDGVYASQGNKFVVSAVENTNSVTIGSGRAWFNHTWTLNDANLTIQCYDPISPYDRTDAVILEIDTRKAVRKNSIKMIQGVSFTATGVNTPVNPPELQNGDGIYQYPLAYIRRNADDTVVIQDRITNMVGTDACPLVTGVVESVSIADLLAQSEAEFRSYMLGFENTAETEFNTWFATIQSQLSGDVAANLQSQISNIDSQMFNMYYGLHNKITVANENAGVIQESVNGVFDATTTVTGNLDSKTIITDIIPEEGTKKYRRKVTVTNNSNRTYKTIVQQYVSANKNDNFPYI